MGASEAERLQKVLANAGVASRRECEKLIVSGRVKVNGKVVRELGSRVHSGEDILHVDNTRVLVDNSHLTVVLNKPAGITSSMSPEADSLAKFADSYGQRLYHVGRLDRDTTGLILLTNDGELAHRLMHPSWEVEKTYLATVKGRFTRGKAKQLLWGVELEDGPAQADRVSIKSEMDTQTLVEITLHSGRNRIVRRMFAHLGHPVIKLARIRFGNIYLEGLATGKSRKLSDKELAELMKIVGL